MYRTTNRPNTRIEVADALRGIAVAGIILFHAREHFNLYWSALDLPRAGFGSWEQPVADMLGFLLSGKMYAIFALLFGLSFFIQSDNQAQRGNDFSLRFAWRMVLLFGIGLVNAAIYNGDVLTYYALFGLLMIPIGKLPNRWVWVIAALLFIQPLELWQYFSGHTLSIRGIEGMETLYPTLATGTFAESARVSLLYGPLSSFGWGLEHGRGTQTLLMFVLGMLAGRYRLFYDEGQHRRIWGGLLAVIGCGILAIKDRDSRAAFIVIGYLAQLLPWVLVTRLTFAYHYFPSEVFLLLALCNVWSRLRELAVPWWRRNMYAVTGVCAGLFVAFYPVLTGLRTAVWYTRTFLRWFPSWPF